MITPEQLEYIEASLGDSLSRRARKDLRDAHYVNQRRDVLAKLLKEFDGFCNKNQIQYFLFGDTLQGAHVYQDFIPGAKDMHLGMLAKEYDKFEKILSPGQVIEGDLVSWSLRDLRSSKHVKKRMVPNIRSYICEPVLIDGREQFKSDSLSLMVENPSFNISVFYSVPDDFFTMRYFYDRIDKLNKRATKLDRVTDGKPTRDPSLIVQSRDKFVRKALKFARSYEDCDTEYCARLLVDRSKKITKDAASNRHRVMFHGIETWAPGDENPWARDPVTDEIPEDLKELQQCALEIVQEIHRVCKELGIGYFACGGTMLGYVRNRGFIPWDDDIDVGMLRADYERFLAEAPAVLDTKRFFLQTAESDPEAPYLFSKIRMNDTLYITEYNQYRDFHKGICVDIFPFDEMPNSASKQAAMKNRARKCSKRFGHVINHRYGKRQVAIDDGRKTLDHRIAHIIEGAKWRRFCSMSLLDLRKAYDKVVTEYSHSSMKDECHYVASFVPTFTMIRKEDLLPYQEVDFEGVKISMPANPEVFLAMQYGDYMSLPPLHQRTGHSLLKAGVV